MPVMALLSKSGSSLNIINFYCTMFMRRSICLKFSTFKTSLKFCGHEPNDMPKSLATSLIVTRQSLSSIIQNHYLQCFNVFIGNWRAGATRKSIIIGIFSAFLKPVVSQLNLCSANIRLPWLHGEHFKCHFAHNLEILKQSSMPHVSCLKHIKNLLGISWYADIISNLSNSDSTTIQNYFLHCFNVFIDCVIVF